MAIGTFSELKTALENWSANTENTARLPDFIALCENRMWYGHGTRGEPLHSEPLRISGMETSADLTIAAQRVSQPDGFLYARRLYLNTSPLSDLEYLVPDRFWRTSLAALDTTGQPVIYTIEGDEFVFAPAPESSFTGKLLYYGKLTALSDNNTTNWLTTNAPASYLYGSLLEYYLYLRNDVEIEKYALLFAGAINSLNSSDKDLQHSGSDLSARPDISP